MAAQINARGVPFISEHLGFLPTLGYFNRARVRELDDGEYELRADLTMLPQERGAVGPSLELSEPAHAWNVKPGVEITFDRRNFDPEVSRQIDLSTSDVVRPAERWAELPPLYYAFVVPVLLSLRLLLGWGLLGSAGSGYECSAGFEVRVVGEAVGFAA